MFKVSGHQYQWLAGGYDLEIVHFLEVVSMVVSWWIEAVLHSAVCFRKPSQRTRLCNQSDFIHDERLQDESTLCRNI